MRNDVKIGLVLSLLAVVASGWFFMRRDTDTAPVPLTAESGDTADNAAEKKASSASTKADRERSASNRGPMTRSQNPASSSNDRTRPTRKVETQNKPTQTTTGSDRHASRTPSSTANPQSSSLNRSMDDVLNTTGRNPIGPTSQNPASSEKPKAAPGSANPNSSATIPSAKPAGTPTPRNTTPAPKAENSTQTRKPEPQKTPLRSRSGKYEMYTVGEGDTLAIIAEAKLGRQKHVDILLAANPGIDPARLTPGTKLVIPLDKVEQMPAVKKTQPKAKAEPKKSTKSASATKPKATQPKKSTKKASPSGRTYTVKKGDSFWKIAEKELGSGVRWPEIFELNKDVVKGKAENLRPGHVLRIPEKAKKAKK